MTLRNLGTNAAGLNTAYARLVGVQATASADGALVVGSHNPVDATAGNLTVALADAVSAGLMVAVSKRDSTANTVTVSAAHLRDTGAGTIVLVGQYEALLLTSKADGSWWPIGDHKTKAWIDTTVSTAASAAAVAAVAAAPSVAAAAAVAVSTETASIAASETYSSYDLAGFVTPTRVVTDTVARTDSSSTMGSADTGQAWAPASTSVWGVTGNKLYLVTNGAGVRAALIDGAAAGLTWSADVTIPSGGIAGIVAGAIDATNMLTVSISTDGNLRILSNINSTSASTRLTEAKGFTVGTYNIAARIEGDSTAANLLIWSNGVLIKEFPLSTTDRAAFIGLTTKYGIYSSSSAQANRFARLRASTRPLATDRKLIQWTASEDYEVTAATIDSDGFATTATVRWPDGNTGTYTLVTKYSGVGVVAVNAYTLTYPPRSRTITQAAPTRDTTGTPTSIPKLTVA